MTPEPGAGPLVWLPFDPADLGKVPAGLRYVWSAAGEPPPGRLDQVELAVPPYEFGAADPSVFGRMPLLRVVQTLTAGVEHLAPHVPEGVLLCNGGGIHDASTAELALTLILASLRGVPGFVRAQDRGEWAWEWRPALADKRVLIIGYGRIGAAIEARLVPFECEVVRVARSVRDGVHAVGELPRLLPEADIVVLIVPATPTTRHLVDAGFLAAMKREALLVNVARGAIIDTDALVAALQAGRVHAALDVTDPEPLPTDHPLWAAPNLLLSPHTGGTSSAMWPRAHRLVREQLIRYAAGEPLANQMDRA